MQEMKNIGQRETVLLGQSDVQSVVGGRGLQFEVEAAAETLAQRQSPGLVDASAEGRVDNQLHPAALVEESFGDDRSSASAHRPARRGLRACIGSTCSAPETIETAFFAQPSHRFRDHRLIPPSFRPEPRPADDR